MFTLHSIARDCRVAGGLRTLEFADPLDLTEQPTWNINTTTELSFKPGKSAIYIEQDMRSGSLSGDHDTDNIAGDFFTYRLDARVRTVRATMESLRAKILNKRIHLIATYMDGVRRLVPYIRLSIADASGTRRADKQGYQITGISRLLLPGPDIAGNITVVPPPIGGGGDTPPIEGAGVQIVTLSITESTAFYLLESGTWLVGWEVRSTSAQTASLGLTAGGTELGGPVTTAPLEVWVGQGNMIPTFDDTNIYFSGLAGTNTIKLWVLSV